MSERANHKKVLTGQVVSAANAKTITVLVENYKTHPLYGKRFKVSKKYHVHDEKGEAKVGDSVRIAETRKISKTKSFRLVKVRQKVEE